MNRLSPKVSVITPTYNHASFIGPCIESVLAQTYEDWEQIVIDDGSTDATAEVVARFRDPRVRYYRQEHHGIEGLAQTYNAALRGSRGALCGILEGDDEWPSDKLEKQVGCFVSSAVVLSWGRGCRIDEQGRLLGSVRPKWHALPRDVRRNIPPGRALRKLIAVNFLVPTSSVMIRRDALLRIGGFRQESGTVWVDHSTWLRIALEGEFCYVDSVLGYWRKHDQQASTRWDISSRKAFYDSLSDKEKRQLRLSGMESLIQSWEDWVQGKKALFAGDREKAMSCLKSVIVRGTGMIRVKALLALGTLILYSSCRGRKLGA